MNEAVNERKDIQNKPSKKPLITYFILSYLITWIFWIPSMFVLDANGWAVPNISNFIERISLGYENNTHLIWSTIFSLGVYGPFLSAIIVKWSFYGKEDLIQMLKSIIKFDFNLKWLGFAFIIPLLLALINLFFNFLTTGDLSGAFVVNYPWYLVIALFISQIFTSGLEEPGWRGFATPEMQKFKNAEDTGFYVGILWGIWHFPFLIYLYMDMMAANTYLIVLSLVGYVALITPMSIIAVWLYNNTKSTGLLILSHAFNNFIPFVVLGTIQDSSGGFVIAIATWIAASIITKKYGKETLTKSNDL